MTDEFVYFPQPTEEELDAPPLFWIGYNPFQWSLLQGKLEEIDNPELWEDYTEEIQDKIGEMFVPMATPKYFYGAKVIRTANQTLAHNTLAAITWQAEEYDNINGWASGQPTRLTVPSDGYYKFEAQITFNTNAVGYRIARLADNLGASLDTLAVVPVNGQITGIKLAARGYFTAGEWVTVEAQQTSGGNLDVLSAVAFTQFSMTFEGTEPPTP